MNAKQAAANSFVFLELGILPVKYEIHKRQLSFLYHIIHLNEEDPVKKVWRFQRTLPCYGNWWNGVEKLLEKYQIDLNEEQIMTMSKETFKQKVKKEVRRVALEELIQENQTKEKTKHIDYNQLKAQSYITELYPSHSIIIFKCRSQTLNIKQHMKYQYENNKHCRWCGVSDETIQHIVSCGSDGPVISDVERIIQEGNNLEQMKNIAERIENFLDRVEV